MDDVTAEQAGQRDAEVLAELRGRRTAWHGVLAVFWAVLALAHLLAGDPLQTVLWGLGALAWGWSWWAGPRLRAPAVSSEALMVSRGLRTRAVPRSDVLDVQPKYGAGGYGLVLEVRGTDALTLPRTAPRSSVAAAQAAALRRWAGLGEPVS